MLEFFLLGELYILYQGAELPFVAPKASQVLALLLLQANRPVDLQTIIEELWNGSPPRSAVTTAQTYIYQLRKMFHREVRESAAGILLTRRERSYLLRIQVDQLDVAQFEQAVGSARAFLDAGRVEEALARVQNALSIWRGRALADIPLGPHLEAHVVRLEDIRIQALELRVEAEMQLGRHREMIADLRSVTAAHPLNEWFYEQLMRALSLSGRRGEALQVYQDLRHLLGEELGIDPSPALQRMQYEVLNLPA
ncbi:BTAD domain-containing putative transcriptional regulator [Streptomyces sp. NPDC050535]|uniref:AfsR/SARP family transcriptional regulator n=1 Tax=Streptomyces sp. NPDC050535 TaxID=3365626 RepID=UPI0037B8FF89